MEADENCSGTMIDANGIDEEEDESSLKRAKPITSGDQMDVEAYAGLYSGRTKIVRLLFIADHCENHSIALEALRMAYDEIKKGENAQLHRDVSAKIDGRLGPPYTLDLSWLNSILRRADQRKDKLENELNNYKVLEPLLLLPPSISSLPRVPLDMLSSISH